MTPFSTVRSRPVALSSGVEAQVYLLVSLAMALTAVGAFLGMLYAATLFSTGMVFGLLIAELALIFTAGWWSRQSPLNIVLFAVFPLLSGASIAPFLLTVIAGYANGAALVLNALAATVFMTAAAGVLAKMSGIDLSGMGRALFLSVLGLLALGILQMVVPSLRTGTVELFGSAAGVVVFGLFAAYDIQRVSAMGRMGMSPFLLALSLYLDIFNLFLSILRFMVAISGDRR